MAPNYGGGAVAHTGGWIAKNQDCLKGYLTSDVRGGSKFLYMPLRGGGNTNTVVNVIKKGKRLSPDI